ncbi:MAG: carboxylate-amine ligase [Gammaproteobacteria bacterium]|nr:carboxylate-amine ligase [Gammaproteobacteria bacterium]
MIDGPPQPGSAQERAVFLELQERLAPMFRDRYADPLAERTVVVIPGLSLDQETLGLIAGARYYEERQLSMLMLLRLPRTRVVFVTSMPVDPVIVDYYLSLLSGVPSGHARRRLTLLSAYDGGPGSLTSKILSRPRLLERIRDAIVHRDAAHLTCFNATADEITLAVRLAIPLYACDPALGWLGTKSGSRQVFREAGVELPEGIEYLRSTLELTEALAELKRRQPRLRRAVVKLEEGFSGEGNAIFDMHDLSAPSLSPAQLATELSQRLHPEADGLSPKQFLAKFETMGGIVEAWLEGAEKRSPSVQMRITPTGELELISTHDQLLGGHSGQVFLGSTFPADERYRLTLQALGLRVGEALRDHGVLGRFSVDFITVQEKAGWRHHAIEVNLRKGGTTLPFQMLQFLTAGQYDSQLGVFLTPTGQQRVYFATDNLCRDEYRRLTPEDLVDIIVAQRLHFDATRQQGIVFSLIGAMSEFGKLGVVSISDSPEHAQAQYRRAVAAIDHEVGVTNDRMSVTCRDETPGRQEYPPL